ncbi:TetR/AcrR family transcriptional regulator [Paenibacillus apiarius]|uniref:TetR/AcrR family transcriptional regulator n=1 Tax=Paenibacillus apiarius TaxID=46240 RepID=A0ABT4DZ46_9BACL|nr:TetR/AcrR family transcriptional regulator [Paenibacillus apiarius]MBN3525040.1 TetR/AcrR family transcriptional regulator [Paenibacillus apiarius]MCY9515124.1 TetR/AcrR family transcriptional regulator [Paenibacillus apiarius]MCY9522632.1 TetR/AcrR family transcriptional regulator [Paenibacillus apiarius]MCY9550330.1 TetR/AcrR family transcriptional regulator [Paenibacillus apiarius]MCY9560728.1 TetR/AcrR family transcriptional regulator [Paenibacillus apiarius]
MNSKAIAIVQAGRRLFFEQGIQETSMEQVAEAVPVAKMTIYKYFQSKEGLLEVIIAQMLEESHQHLRKVIAEAGDTYDLFRRMMEYHDFDDVSKAFINDLVQYYPAVFQRLMSYSEEHILPEFEAAIFRGQQEGHIRKELSPHLIVRFLVSMKQFMAQPGKLDGCFSMRTISDQLMTMLCHGMLVDRDPHRV